MLRLDSIVNLNPLTFLRISGGVDIAIYLNPLFSSKLTHATTFKEEKHAYQHGIK